MIVANNFWTMSDPARLQAANAFFEHISLIGGFVLVAAHRTRKIVPLGPDR
jgi:uncharacterized membrane protein YphA (DoxX/SURF4 family)